MDEQRSPSPFSHVGQQELRFGIDPARTHLSSHIHESGDVQFPLHSAPVHEGCRGGEGTMRMFRIIAASAATLSVAAAGACISERSSGPTETAQACTAHLPSAAFGTTIVIIRNFQFSPATVNVARGSKVTWVNCGAPGKDSHTSSADARQWTSQLLAPGDTYTQEFTSAGSFPYHCDPHPSMHGTVTVQ